MGLFSWFRNLFRTQNTPDDYYKPKERLIYRYWNGSKDVSVDPMVIYKRVMEHSATMSIDYKVSRSELKDAPAAHNRLVKQVREIFELVPFEQGGLSEIEALTLLDHFMSFCASIKKNSNPSPISHTETSDHSAPISTESQTTSNSSDSGSIENERSTDKPSPLSSAQA